MSIFIHCVQFPLLYQEGVQNILFSWIQILGWMFNGVITALMIFFFCTKALQLQAFNQAGKVLDYQILGATMYTCIVWVVNLQMALSVRYFTLIQHVFIWGGIALWYLFLIIYGAFPSTVSTTGYSVFIEALAPAPSFWLLTLFVVVSSMIPYFTYSAVKMRFFPMYHEMIQWLRSDGYSEDYEYCELVRRRSLRSTTVGSTARRFARSVSKLWW